MLACVYPPESFKSKAVTIKVRHGKSRRKAKIVSIKGKSDKSSATSSHNELPVGGGGAVLVLSELESMAARQQREIAQQRRLLEQREARLAVLRGTQEPAHQEKLARLRHRLDQQQSKLNRLRLLRSQTDQSRANNATLTSDLDCIRALFNEKEKELSLAVAKVEELTRQLEELRGRRNNAGAPGHIPTPASAELEKLRKELMYRNKMNEQQNQVVSQQRLALAQRQAEMASIDARIVQLQGRLQRKKALNQRMSQQLAANGRTPGGTGFGESKLDFNSGGKSRPAGNIAAIEPYSHIPNDNDFNLNKNDPKYQTLPYNTKFTVNFKTTDDDVNKNKIQHSASASQIGQRTTLQQFGHQIAHSQSQSHIQGQSQPLNNQQQNGSPNFTSGSQFLCNNNNNNNNNNLTTNNNNNINNNIGSGLGAENQNLRLLQQKPQLVGPNGPNTLNAQQQGQMHRNSAQPTHQKPVSSVAPSFPVKSPIYQTSSTKIHPVMPQTLSLIGRGQSYPVQSQAQPNSPNGVTQEQNYSPRHNFTTTNSSNFTSGYPSHGFGQTQQPLPGSISSTTAETPNERLKFEPGKVQDKFEQMRFEPQNQQAGQQQQRFEQFVKAENHVVPKYEQTTKPFEYDRLKSEADSKKQNFGEMKTEDKTKPALPPKPSKPNPPPRLTHHDKVETTNDALDNKSPPGLSRLEKEEEIPPIPTSEPPESPTETQLSQPTQPTHQVIKARPLGLKKAPLFEQPKLRYSKSNIHVSINRRIEMPPAFLFPETEIPADLMQTEHQHQGLINDNEKTKKSLADELTLNGTEKLEDSDIVDALNVINIEDKLKGKTEGCNERRPEIVEIDGVKAESVIRRKKGNLKSTTGKANLSRRVSFDPLALLLDASLEGELELVKKTAKEVANPSSANDEGITALHNAICAGHLEIVKFLVEFGCDVNAQDSDGWTPLHCAASCNNLAMVRFLVEHGACIFATTLSDQETAAEKCEEDEEGFDGCSEYLYSVQEKLGIMNSGQVYAVFDYEKQHSDELSLKNGDSLVILRKGDDNEREWWWSKLANTEGYVPRNLLGLYPRVQPAQID